MMYTTLCQAPREVPKEAQRLRGIPTSCEALLNLNAEIAILSRKRNTVTLRPSLRQEHTIADER